MGSENSENKSEEGKWQTSLQKRFWWNKLWNMKDSSVDDFGLKFLDGCTLAEADQ